VVLTSLVGLVSPTKQEASCGRIAAAREQAGGAIGLSKFS
jgi:hypothetical protein